MRNEPEKRAAEIILRLPEAAHWVEVGVWRGDNARRVMMGAPPGTRITLVDPWRVVDSPEYREYATKDARATQEEMDWYYKETRRKLKPWAKQARLIRGTSVEAAALCAGEQFDLVFIDAEHTYDALRADIEAWLPRVKPDGWIGGHDFNKERFPGVTQAVREAFGEDVVEGADSTWWAQMASVSLRAS